MSRDPARSVIAALTPGALFTHDDVCSWPAGVFDALVSAGVLTEGKPAAHVVCDACYSDHTEVVERRPGEGGGYFMVCPEAGIVGVSSERLRQWRVSWTGTAAWISSQLRLKGSPMEILPPDTWRAGYLPSESGDIEVVLVGSDAAGVVERDAIILATGQRCASPRAVWLPDVLSVSDAGLWIDVEMVLAAAPRPAPQAEGVCSDGVRFRGSYHQLGLTKKERAFLDLAMFRDQTPIADLMNLRGDAVWDEEYTDERRGAVHGLLHRVNAKLVDASPPLRMRFSLQGSSVVRHLG